MAQVQNFMFDQGASFENTWTVNGLNGTAVDLTLYSARCYLKKHFSNKTHQTLTATVLDPKTDGQIKLQCSPTESRAIPAGRWEYTLEAYTANDVDVIRVSEGTVTISPTTYSAPVV
jgi:hypothetical protein